MKKGLRRPESQQLPGRDLGFKRGPDEEGIETHLRGLTPRLAEFKRGPDEEGIETRRPPQKSRPGGSNADLMKKGLRQRQHPRFGVYRRSNADLMKKGLRLDDNHRSATPSPFKRGPDEEGIETTFWDLPRSRAVQTRT